MTSVITTNLIGATSIHYACSLFMSCDFYNYGVDFIIYTGDFNTNKFITST